MTNLQESASPAPAAQPWNQDLIFFILAEPARRQLLRLLADGGPRPASGLIGPSRRRDSTIKHLMEMRDAGLVVTKENPSDRRQTLYELAPSVPLTKNDATIVFDFGFCTLRF